MAKRMDTAVRHRELPKENGDKPPVNGELSIGEKKETEKIDS